VNISYRWLKEYLDIDLSPEELNDKLTFSGIEVESVKRTGELFNQIIIGEIREKEKHPEADKLSVCMVFDGTNTHQVVCGAPNCAKGQRIAFAPIGTDFPEFKIKKAKLRGVESNGMICSEKELGVSDNHEGIWILPGDAPIGTVLSDYSNLSDVIFEVEITPNRPDLLGMLGIARDLSAQLNLPLKQWTQKSEVTLEAVEKHDDFVVENTVPELCARYTATRIRGVKVAPSPQWLVEKLQAAAIKPINNIVDITNFVMYEYGHPLHAFDEKYVNGSKVIIRKSFAKEKFPALDNNEYELTGGELVIADADKVVALAGVIGGKNSHITEETTDIILEAACFDSSLTRKTSHNFKIFTDSSYRFERGMASATCEVIAAKATELVLKLAGGKAVFGMIDSYPNPKENKVIALRPDRVKKLLSISLESSKIINYLQNLGLKYLREDGSALYFEIPSYRVDLTREIDLIEEIIRLHGFDKVGDSPDVPNIMNKDIFYARRNIKALLVNAGFSEAVNITFSDPAFLHMLSFDEGDYRRRTVKILNPQGESFSILRSTLLPGLLKNVLLNVNHGAESVKLFEMNKVFTRQNEKLATEKWRLTGVLLGNDKPVYWKEKGDVVNFYDVKGVVESLLGLLRINDIELTPSDEPFYLPNSGFSVYTKKALLGSMGKLDKKLLQKFDIETEVYVFDIDLDNVFEHTDFSMKNYAELDKFPTVHRDLSFVVSEEHLLRDMTKTIKEVNPKIIKNVVPFDQFKGKQIKEGFRSLSLSISLNSETKTLTDEQIKTIMNKIIERLQEKYTIEMR
jgi:phenylalanyl-tRNA synthetase beta chain